MPPRSRERLGLALLNAALNRPEGWCLPNDPIVLLLERQEVPHDECSAQPAPADAQPARRGGRVQRRSVELS